jgi:hypothetical protein
VERLPDVAEAGEGRRAAPVRRLLADRTPRWVAGRRRGRGGRRTVPVRRLPAERMPRQVAERRRVRGGVPRRASQSYGRSYGGSKQAVAADDKSSGKDAVA